MKTIYKIIIKIYEIPILVLYKLLSIFDLVQIIFHEILKAEIFLHNHPYQVIEKIYLNNKSIDEIPIHLR